MPGWSSRIDAATAGWRARLNPEQAPHPGDGAEADASALAALEHAARELERDLAKTGKQVDALTSRAAELEQRAMQAIQESNDAGAREALLVHRECTDELARLEADAAVLRASIAECRAVRANTDPSV